MARRTAVAIGVKKSGPLPALPGAVNGALQFAQWARDQHFDAVYEFTDQRGSAVLAAPILDRMTQIVDSATGDDSLFVFFAGHGLLFSGNVDTWLLSRWDTDPNEAINVTQSFANAKLCGLQHVALFADACRTAGGKDSVGLGGYVVFPRRKVYNVSTQWDQFLATRPGLAAQEVVPDDQLQAAYGVFSKVLLDGLGGAAIESVTSGRTPYAITSQMLASHVEREVPEASAAIAGAAVQYPEGNSGSRDPYRFYAWLDAPPKPKATQPAAPAFAPPPSGRDLESQAISRLETEILNTTGRESFETRAGLTIVGAHVKQGVVTGGRADLFEEGGNQHVRAHGDKPLSAALQLDNGRWIGTTIFPDFIGTILVSARGIDSISYVPSRSSPLWNEYDVAEARQRLSRALARHTFAGSAPVGDEAISVAQDLRMLKHVNPSLGILAAYAYNSATRHHDVLEIARYMSRDAHLVPYDVARLTDLPIRPNAGAQQWLVMDSATYTVAGSFPLLTLGWALIGPDDGEVSDVVRSCLPGILPSTWTMLRPTEGARLADAIARGDI